MAHKQSTVGLWTRSSGLAIGVVALVCVSLTAQEATFRGGNRTVAVYATVTGVDGRLVPDLSRDAFSILDNGKHTLSEELSYRPADPLKGGKKKRAKE